MKKKLRRRGLSLLLAVVLLLSLAPAALAADPCPQGGTHTVTTWETVREANCHETGVRQGLCTKCNGLVYETLSINPSNHDAICTDNGDGATHTATCMLHPAYTNVREPHTFVNGRCTKCMAVDYSSVTVSLPRDLERYVAVGDTAASLTLGDITLTLGAADVTDDYTLSYSWYYQGSAVGTGESYTLPAAATAKEGDFTYVCFVMAVPKNSLSSKPISASCTVTVRVRDLATAYATVSAEDLYITLADTNGRTTTPVADQIYDAIYARTDNYPSYVVFGAKPTSRVGTLRVNEGQRYYFVPTPGQQTTLGDVRFEPSRQETGAYTINFTSYDVRGNAYPGTLTITVEQSLGKMDVLYATSKGTPAALKAADFSAFWQQTYPQGALTLVRFTKLPAGNQGSLYYNYTSATQPGSRVKAGESYYAAYAGGRNQGLLDGVTFVPAANFTGYLSIPFEAYGQNNRGIQTYLSGSLAVFVSDGTVRSVNYNAANGGVKLNAADFLAVYQSAVGATAPGGFYLQLLEVPASGALYLNYTGGLRDTRLTAANVSAHPLYYSNALADEIGDVTYLPGTALSESVRYVAYDNRGQMLYIGSINFTRGELSVSYTASSSGVPFTSADFERALGLTATAAAGTYLTFSQPTSGSLTYTKTNLPGTAVTVNDRFYLGTNLMSVNNLLYTPQKGQNGMVSIPFTAYLAGGSTMTGTVKITVRTAYTKSFRDVKSTDWFYTAVMDLAEAGVINGMTPTTYEPNTEVTYGQALKLILLASGYSEPTKTGKHWASGYLTVAHRDGLLPTSVTEAYLDRKINRYTIAEMAAKALRLPATTLTSSPFADMTMKDAAAPYVLALYEAGIVEGTAQSNGKVNYYGVNSITRAQMATIVWRINNVKK